MIYLARLDEYGPSRRSKFVIQSNRESPKSESYWHTVHEEFESRNLMQQKSLDHTNSQRTDSPKQRIGWWERIFLTLVSRIIVKGVSREVRRG